MPTHVFVLHVIDVQAPLQGFDESKKGSLCVFCHVKAIIHGVQHPAAGLHDFWGYKHLAEVSAITKYVLDLLQGFFFGFFFKCVCVGV